MMTKEEMQKKVDTYIAEQGALGNKGEWIDLQEVPGFPFESILHQQVALIDYVENKKS